MDNKSILRNCIKKRILKIPKTIREKENLYISEKIVQSFDYINAKKVFIYISLENEVDTAVIIDDMFKKNKTVAVPICVDNYCMEARIIKSFNDLEIGKYGLLEPKNYCEKLNPKDIDLCIMPCLAVNLKGFRLGKGKGYYDRYIKNQTFKTFVLAFSCQIVEDIPMESFDVPCDKVFTYVR